MNIQRRLPVGKYRLQVPDYERLAEAGVFGDYKTQLIEGDVIVMSPQFRPHGMAKLELYDQLRDLLLASGSPLRPVVEFSLALSAESMPDPDIMLTSEPRGSKAVPLASVALVIEIADTTLAHDLGVKQRLYAGAAIPEYWVVDVNGRVIHRMWTPGDVGYGQQDEKAFGGHVGAVTIADLSLDTSML